MEVFDVNSLLELQRLRQLFRAFPSVLFTGGYVSVRVEVHGINHVMHALLVKRILDDFALNYNCEVPNQNVITDVASLANSLLVLKRMVHDVTSDAQLYSDMWFQMLGRAAQIVREMSAFATGSYGDMLFSVTKSAVSCANTGLDLLDHNITSTHRWATLNGRLSCLSLMSSFCCELGCYSEQLAPDDARTSFLWRLETN